MTSFSALRQHSLLRSPWIAILLALVLGALAGLGAALDPLIAMVAIPALLVCGALLMSVRVGLVASLAIATLLPFGTLPFRAIVTPALLELTLAGVMTVWVLRMLAQRDDFPLRITSDGVALLVFLGLSFFALVLGAGGLPDFLTLHNYGKFVLALLFFFTIVNTARTPDMTRFLLRCFILFGGLAALLGLLLYVMPNTLSEPLLTSLGRIGYPTEGRILRFVEDDTEGIERAIGTSVDPNSFGGMLALVCALAAAQLFAQKPVFPRLWLIGLTGAMALALLLTFSRGALFGLLAAAAFLATLRYRRLWRVLIGGAVGLGLLMLVLGIGAEFATRLSEGVQFQDQAQQMRLAEYQNAVAVIARYPVFGIGFGLAPDLDLTAGVSSIYLSLGQRMGLVGLLVFMGIVAAWFIRTLRILPRLDEEYAAWLVGAQAGIVAALVVGLADHYFFNIEFSHMAMLFWGVIGLGTAITLLVSSDSVTTDRPHPSVNP